MLNAELIDEDVIHHNSGRDETVRLYKTKEKFEILSNQFGEFGQPYAWVEMTCPSTNQVYLLDTCASYTKSVDAMKFSRPSDIPFDLEYNWQQFAN